MDNDFNIQETVNRNIQKNQFKAFYNHRSLVGWCSMNYPKVLVNPVYSSKPDKDRNYDLDHMFQQKQPKDRDRTEFTKPFRKQAGQDTQEPYQKSSLTLATTKHEVKADIFQRNHKLAEEYSAVKPLSCVLGANKDNDFDRKIRQIGEVVYKPSFQSEEIRHLRKLPNTIVTEQNLMEIMDSKLEFLDIQNNAFISNELVNKIGYFAPNIRQLNLSSTGITDDVVHELAKSCKLLTAIDISKCPKLTSPGVIKFLELNKQLTKFWANHNINSIVDDSLKVLTLHKDLTSLSINFCYEVTSTSLQQLLHLKLTYLSLSSLPNVKNETFQRLIETSNQSLVHLDISFNREEVNNQLMSKVGNCLKLDTLVLTDNKALTDQCINYLVNGQKGKNKPVEGLPKLRVLKLSGVTQLSDSIHNLIKKCPSLESLDVNNLQRLTDSFLDHMKNHPKLERILMNFTPNISDAKLSEVRQTSKRPLLIRNIIKMTDPADDGLRMPLPLASMKKKKPKKKKK